MLVLSVGGVVPASAALPACGVYRNEITGLHIDVLNAVEAVEYQLNPDGQPINRTPYLLGVQDGRAHAVPAELGGLPQVTGITLSADGQRFVRQQGPGRDFERVQDHPCQESRLPPPGACRNRIEGCMERLADRGLPAQVFKRACDEGVAFACLRWVETVQLDAVGVASKARERLTAGPALDVLAEPPALADDVLQQLPAICERHRSMGVCEAVGRVLWRGLQPERAVLAWRTGCGRPNPLDSATFGCDRYQEVAARLGDQPQVVAATRVPCGLYRGRVWDLEFHEDGTATFNGGETHAAHVETGDLVFHLADDIAVHLRPLADGRLLGLNSILQHEVLIPDGAMQCAESAGRAAAGEVSRRSGRAP